MLLDDYDTSVDHPIEAEEDQNVRPTRHLLYRQYSLPNPRRTPLFSFPVFRRQGSSPNNSHDETEKMLYGELESQNHMLFDSKLDIARGGQLKDEATDEASPCPADKETTPTSVPTANKSSSRWRSRSEPAPAPAQESMRKEWQNGNPNLAIPAPSSKKNKAGSGGWYDRFRGSEKREIATDSDVLSDSDDEGDVDDTDDLAMMKPSKGAVSGWKDVVQTQRMFRRSRWVAVGDDE